jgi:tetratricopeptide (TPR) repeat protein
LIFGFGKKKKEENDRKGDDRSTHISGPITNSPISSGEFHGPVNYDYSSSTTINITISAGKFRSALEEVKKTPDKKFQIQGSSKRTSDNISNQDLDVMQAATKALSDEVKNIEKQTPGLRVKQVRTSNDLLFSRNELLTKEALIEGNKYFAMGKYDEAILSFDRILRLNPNHDVALNNKGSTLIDSGKPSKALSYLDKALSINPNNDVAWSTKGMVYNVLGKPSKALSYFDKALSINPNDDRALTYKGMALNDLGRPSEALPLIDKALSINPNNGYAWLFKSEALDDLGRIVESKECLKRARQLGLKL